VRRFFQQFNPFLMFGWVLAVVVGCVAAFSGCQSFQAVKGNSITGQFLEASSKTITLATWGSHEELGLLRSALAEFEEQQPAIKVTLRHVPENYLQKLHLLAAGNLFPDVVMINSWHLPVFAHYGVVAPVESYLKESDFSDFYPQAVAALSYQGRAMAVPRDVSNLVMVVNKSLLSKKGIAYPQSGWSMAKLNEIAQQLCAANTNKTASNTDVYAMAINRRPVLFWLPWVWSFGGDIFNDQGQLLSDSAPEFKQAALGLATYMNYAKPDKSGCQVAPTPTQLGQASPTQWFLQQRLAMLVTGRWSVPLFRNTAEFDWDVLPLPQGVAGSITGIDATGYALSAKSANPEAAAKLITFLTSKQALANLASGGLVIPARQSVANSSAFLSSELLPKHDRTFLEVIQSGHPTVASPEWGRVEDALHRALDPVWEKETITPEDVEQALNRARASLNG
jgi:multiple sugar transport system substrate-binding protein